MLSVSHLFVVFLASPLVSDARRIKASVSSQTIAHRPESQISSSRTGNDWIRFDKNCFRTYGAKNVPLGRKSGGAIEGLTLEGCRALCMANEKCSGIVFSLKTSKCYGRRQIHLDKCRDAGNGYFTEVYQARSPAKCKTYGCDQDFIAGKDCQCNSLCVERDNCCSDYQDLCGGNSRRISSTEERLRSEKREKKGRQNERNAREDPSQGYNFNARGASCRDIGCDLGWDKEQPCQCSDGCQLRENCCSDYRKLCGTSNHATLMGEIRARAKDSATYAPTYSPTYEPTRRPLSNKDSATYAPTYSPTYEPTRRPLSNKVTDEQPDGKSDGNRSERGGIDRKNSDRKKSDRNSKKKSPKFKANSSEDFKVPWMHRIGAALSTWFPWKPSKCQQELRDRYYGSAGCLIIEDDKILMVRAKWHTPANSWDLPGGHIENHEWGCETAEREACEEIQMQVTARKILPYAIYRCEIVNRNAPCKPGPEGIKDMRWIPIKDFRNTTLRKGGIVSRPVVNAELGL